MNCVPLDIHYILSFIYTARYFLVVTAPFAHLVVVYLLFHFFPSDFLVSN